MSYDVGIDFRSTSGYVTDPANCTYSVDVGSGQPEDYPITRGGITFGWTNNGANIIGCRDRNNTLDARIAGMQFIATGVGTRNFRLNIPATGSATIHAAFGDTSGGATGGIYTIYDGDPGGTTLVTVDSGGSAVLSGHSLDASGADRTDAAWPGSETGVAVNITSDHITMVMNPAYSQSAAIRHLRVISSAASAGKFYFFLKSME